MPSPDDIGAAARDAAQTYGAEQYAAGATSRQPEVDGLRAQETADVATIAAVRAANAGLQAANVALQAAFDAYVSAHPAAEEPPPVDPPVVMGMNFAPVPQAGFEALADVARIFVDDGRTDIRQEPEFVRAYAANVRTFVFSWKDPNARWFGTVPDDVEWYGVREHEPENDIAAGNFTLAQWKAWQAVDMPKVRAAGGIPWVILMGYTMAPASKRNPADYTLPAGTVDGYGIDFYPDKSPNRTQAQIIGSFKAMLPTWGVQRWSVCEYGVIGTAPDAVADIIEVKPLIADAEIACYWSAQATGKPNYRFTEQTASAWFA